MKTQRITNIITKNIPRRSAGWQTVQKCPDISGKKPPKKQKCQPHGGAEGKVR